ncbi:MAG TPA: glycosyltransferase family 39 protein [Steroidobacteraceae bacterium]|nr:glycosyltransferase family 39 protein [Steroidobacteraceae bacterium]
MTRQFRAWGDPHRMRWLFGAVLLLRLLFPFFNSPLTHLFSDPLRHWNNGLHFLHPDLMGGDDPFLYQAWLAVLQFLSQGSEASINLGCALLCVLMPYGWYRALREILPKTWALGGASLIGLWPSGLGMYAYFMNETLLLALLGAGFWATFRARRKGTAGAFALASFIWTCAAFTRTVAVPLALLNVLYLVMAQPGKLRSLSVAAGCLLVLLLPAAWHSRAGVGFAAPLGNLYLNEIYAASGKRDVSIDAGPAGSYIFSSPSFYNPSFYPFSEWISDRSGVFDIHVDLKAGRRDWRNELARARAQRTFPRWQQRWDDFLFLLFAQSWPDNDRGTLSGWLSVWNRWLWLPLVLAVAWGVARERFQGREWLLPICGFGVFALLAVQSEGAMEGRFRKPLEPIFLAAVIVIAYRSRHREQALYYRS